MKRGAVALPLSLIAGAVILSCVDIPTGAEDVLSLEMNSLPSPSVVAGDTLRDSSGVVAPLSVTAYNYQNQVVEGVSPRFRAFDARVRVDSLTGILIGDSATSATSRVLATLDGFSTFLNVPVSLRPDTVIGANERDSLSYSVTDTTANVSNAIGVKLLHGLTTTDSAVSSYLVKFDVFPAADTLLARLVTDGGNRASADTTDVNGIAERKIRIDVSRITNAIDSVIVMASVRFRGQHVRGSPMRLVLKLKPK